MRTVRTLVTCAIVALGIQLAGTRLVALHLVGLIGVPLFGGLTVFSALRTFKPANPWPWQGIGVMFFGGAANLVALLVLSLYIDDEAADIFLVGQTALSLIAGGCFLRLLTRRLSLSSRTLYADLAIAVLVAWLVLWTFFTRAALMDSTTYERVRTAATVVIIITLCTLIPYIYRVMTVQKNRTTAMWFLITSLPIGIIADWGLYHATEDEITSTTHWYFATQAACTLLVAVGISRPGMKVFSTRLPHPLHGETITARLWLLAIATSVIPATAVLSQHLHGAIDAAWTISATALLISVICRIALLLRSQALTETDLETRIRQQVAVAQYGLSAVRESDMDALCKRTADAAIYGLPSNVASLFTFEGPDGAPVEKGTKSLPGNDQSSNTQNDELVTAVVNRMETKPYGIIRRNHASICYTTVQDARSRPFALLTSIRRDGARFSDGDVNFLRSIGNILQSTLLRAESEAEMVRSQKLESLGQLAAGIAHEINTPVQFVSNNIRFLKRISASYENLFNEISTWIESEHPELTNQVEELRAQANMDVILQGGHEAIEQSLDGIARVTTIVEAMKVLAHPGKRNREFADINRSLESTVRVIQGETNSVAEVITDFHELPAVFCNIGELSQVFLNLMINACHAVADAKETRGIGTIRVKSASDGQRVVISISDTGKGIPKEAQARIYEPFFTTKETGRGTGQGLPLAKSIVESHRGELWFETGPNGTTFFVTLPIRPANIPDQEPVNFSAPAVLATTVSS